MIVRATTIPGRAQVPMILLIPLLTIGLDPLNESVVSFARSHAGQKVGNGECSTLVIEALKSAGAQRPDVGPGWARELPSLRDSRPGDIVMFENAVFVRRRMLPSGALVTLSFTLPHHTAIVSGVRTRGKRVFLSILHQNAGWTGTDAEDLRVVREWTLDSAEMRKGTVKAYRPQAEGTPEGRREP
jgi:hypothetical protein